MWSFMNLTMGTMGLAASLVGGRVLVGGCCPPENVVKSDQKEPVVARVIASRAKGGEDCESACSGVEKSALKAAKLAALSNAKGGEGCESACGKGTEKAALTAATLAALINAKGGEGCESACGKGTEKSALRAATLAALVANSLKGTCPPDSATERNIVLSLSPQIVDGKLTLSASAGLPGELAQAFTLCPPGGIDGAVASNFLLALKPMLADGELTLSVVGECRPQEGKEGGHAVRDLPMLGQLLVGRGAAVQPGDARFEIKTLNGDDELHVVIENGEVVKSDRNGHTIKIEMDKDENGNIKCLKDEYGNVLWEGGGWKSGHDVIIDAQGSPLTMWQRNATEPRVLQWQGSGANVPEGATWWSSQAQPAEQPKVMLGVVLGEPDEALLKHLGLEPGQATLLTNVYPGFPAEQAGLSSYDVVVGVNGSGSASNDEIRSALRGANPGDTVRFTVFHRGEKRDVKVRLEAYDQSRLSEASREHGAESPATGALQLAVPPPPPVPGMAPRAPGEPGQMLLERRMLNDGDVVIRRREAMAERERAMADAERAMAEMREQARANEQEFRRSLERSGGDADERMQRLEERLGRLEKMLERMIEREESKSSTGAGRRS